MPSVIDLVEVDALVPGAVLPIERHLSIARGLWPLGAGGSLYLAATGPAESLWLVAILEAPEQSQLRPRDRRKRGWYAPANVTPVREITGVLKTSRFPRKLTAKEETALRELIDEPDSPLIEAGARDSSPGLRSGGPPLERALAHAMRDDIAAVIGELLEVWRETRAVELADLIDRANRLLPTYDRPLSIERCDDTAIEKAWQQAFSKHPVAAMPQLLQYSSTGADKHFAKRWTGLASLPDDPRISRRIAAHLASSINDLTLEILERGRDATSWTAAKLIAEDIEVIIDDGNDDPYSAWETEILARSQKFAFARERPAGKLPNTAPPLIAAIEHELERLEAPARAEATLIDAIAEDWRDDEPRSIYADWLIERGHPRGEHLALLLRGEKRQTPAQRRRFAMLSDVPMLYGVLDEVAVMQRRVRDRGIDRSLDIYWSTTPLMWQALGHSALIRALTKIRLVGDPRLDRAEAIGVFVARAPRLTTIEDIDTAKQASHLTRFLGEKWRYEAKKQQLIRKP